MSTAGRHPSRRTQWRGRGWWIGTLVVLLAGGGALWVWGQRDSTVLVARETTSSVVRRDISQTLRLSGTAQTVTRTVPGATSMQVTAAIPAESLYELVPAVNEARADVTVSIQGRPRVACAVVRVLGASPAPATAAPDATQAPGGPELECALPADVVAYLSESATVRAQFTSTSGRRLTVEIAGPVGVSREPDRTERDHDQVVAEVDPSVLYLLLPSVDAGDATGQAIIPGEGRTFSCDAVTMLDATADAPDKYRTACHLPNTEQVFAGVAVTLIVTTAHATHVLSVPTSAIRTRSGDQGVVTVVTGGGTALREERTVTLGVSDGLSTEIRAGLDQDDLVLDPAVQE